MELSQIQKDLVQTLKSLKMTEEEVIAVMLAVKQPEKTNKLADYIIEQNEKNQLDRQKLIIKAMEISQE